MKIVRTLGLSIAALGLTAGAFAGPATAATGNMNVWLQNASATPSLEVFESAIDQHIGQQPWDQIVSPDFAKDLDTSKASYTMQSDLLPLQALTIGASRYNLRQRGIDPNTEASQGTEAELAGRITALFIRSTEYQPGPGEIDSLEQFVQSGAPVNPDGVVSAWRAGFNSVVQ